MGQGGGGGGGGGGHLPHLENDFSPNLGKWGQRVN